MFSRPIFAAVHWTSLHSPLFYHWRCWVRQGKITRVHSLTYRIFDGYMCWYAFFVFNGLFDFLLHLVRRECNFFEWEELVQELREDPELQEVFGDDQLMAGQSEAAGFDIIKELIRETAEAATLEGTLPTALQRELCRQHYKRTKCCLSEVEVFFTEKA